MKRISGNDHCVNAYGLRQKDIGDFLYAKTYLQSQT